MDSEALFRQILKPALGCTEPVAVALATAAAYQASGGWVPATDALPRSRPEPSDIRGIRVSLSPSFFKNSYAIAIPNAGKHKGLPISAALGLFCDPRRRMALLDGVDPQIVARAESIVGGGMVTVEVDDAAPSDVYVRIEVELADGSGTCIISDNHTNIACLQRNGAVIHGSTDRQSQATASERNVEELRALPLAQVLQIAEHLPPAVLSLLRETVDKNLAACKAGLERPMGIGTGYLGAGEAASYKSNNIACLTAAGSDARMSGFPVEIMTSAGSGNQGIMATIPIVIYARMRLIDDERMLKALAISHLMTMYITSYVGYLSALCGVAIKAGIGAACGLTYLMGGGVEEIEAAVKIMAATLTGMICDGAKAGCALKVSSAADMSLRAATLAMQKAEVPDDNGIVARSAEETIRNIARLGQAMKPVDQNIIKIMLTKIPTS